MSSYTNFKLFCNASLSLQFYWLLHLNLPTFSFVPSPPQKAFFFKKKKQASQVATVNANLCKLAAISPLNMYGSSTY